MNKIKIAYIGGGSRLWARNLMSDMALEKDLSGEVVLYDIVLEAAENNAIIGNKMMQHQDAVGDWKFIAAKSLEEAVTNADFILISILPGTFKEMESYVHGTEKWGVYQTVGDTVGPSGVFRSLIMMPMYEVIALAIKKYAKDAWVINFTNPMTMCVQTLYEVYPEIKAFGNCHEIFFVQRILARALLEKTGIDVPYHEIEINPIGINHFTWINYASYGNIDLMPIYREFVDQYKEFGLVKGKDGWLKVGPFGSAEKVKLDLFNNFDSIAAAGDRHLVEFLPHAWYLKDKETIDKFKFHLTPVKKRIEILEKGNRSAIRIKEGLEEVSIIPSGEEGVAQIKALLGLTEIVTNVNMPNTGQISNLPYGHVVETNALFRKDSVRPIISGNLPGFAQSVTNKHILNHRLLLKSFKTKDLFYARQALKSDLSLEHLYPEQIDEMFDEIIDKIKHYLSYYEKGFKHE
jgi:alpha-galactosidase/6-phospho-beta-glucosidase family protein